MRARGWFVLAVVPVATALAVGASEPLAPDPIDCASCEAWNRPREPFRVYGNTWYVGTAGLSALLVTSDAGHVLLDGALPQSAPLIAENVRALGFRLEDVRLLLCSHEHYDHVGGLAALQRWTGAPVAAGAPAAEALRRGEPLPDDPQHGMGREEIAFPPVREVRSVGDGETLRVGAIAITAHRTPGHTPGGTTWTWRSCQDGRCLDGVYADSLTAVSAPGYRFSDAPEYLEAFRRTLARVRALPCDVLVSTHPSASGLDERLARRASGETPDPLVDAGACRAYADGARERLEKRLADER